MTNEEKINEIISSCKNDSENLDFNFNEQNARFVLGWFADWKEQEFDRKKQALIDDACFLICANLINTHLFSNDSIVEFVTRFRQLIEETK